MAAMNDDFSSQPIGGDIGPSSPHEQSNKIDGNRTEEVDRININQLPFEVLLLIFHWTVDIESIDMQRSFPSYPPHYVRVQTPADRLASVCKYWRKIVCDSALTSESLWSVHWHDPKHVNKGLGNLENFIHAHSVIGSKSLMKPTLLDVFITDITATICAANLDWNSLRSNVLIPFTTAISFNYSFRTLSLYISDKNQKPFTSLYFPTLLTSTSLCYPDLLTSLRRLHLECRGYRGGEEGNKMNPLSWLRLDVVLNGIPRLEELKLIGWESVWVPVPVGRRYEWRGQQQEPVLPYLRCMEMTVLKRIQGRVFAILMRYAPSLEDLRLCEKVAMDDRPYHPPSEVVVLPHLRRIHIHNRRFLPYPFVKGWIKTPLLSEVVIERTKRPRRATILGWREFLALNPTITKLSFPTKPGYTVFLSEAPSIEHITLDARRSTGDGWLRRLGERDTKSLVSNERLRICPNLRMLTLLLGSKYPSKSTFETFICAQCIPTDGEGNTAMGYKALKQVVLRFPTGSASFMEPMAIKIGKGAWGDVEMERGEHDGGSEFRLKWRYDSGPHSCS